MSASDAAAVAGFMFEAVHHEGFLSHFRAIELLDDRFTYLNARGRRAISPDVLSAFRKLSGDSIVWCRRGKFWRPRAADDRPGRLQ